MSAVREAPLLCIALDDLAERETATLRMAMDLSEAVGPKIGFKLNLDYLLLVGIHEAIGKIRLLGPHPIFADIKMWNGGRTMVSVVRELVSAGVDYLTIYALADGEMEQTIAATRGTSTKVLGVTVLTHFDEKYCKRHFGRSFDATVRHLAETAFQQGCDGLILPGTNLDAVADLDMIKAVPGIRPKWYQDTRHEQEVTPTLAVQRGASLLVCGSPVIKSAEPISALRRLLAEIEEAHE